MLHRRSMLCALQAASSGSRIPAPASVSKVDVTLAASSGVSLALRQRSLLRLASSASGFKASQIADDGTHHVTAEGGTPLYSQRFASVLAFHHPPGLAPAQFRECGSWAHITMAGQPAYARRFARTFGFYEGLAAVDSYVAGAGDGSTPAGTGSDGWQPAGSWYHILPNGEPAYSPTTASCPSAGTTSSPGSSTFQPRWSWCGNFQHGRCPVRLAGSGHYTHIDASGMPRTGGPYAYAGDFREGFAVVQLLEDGLCRHVDREGRLLQCEAFGGPSYISIGSGKAGAQTSNRAAQQLSLSRLPGFLDLDVFHKGFARARDKGGWFFLRRDGSDACRGQRFAEIEPFYNGQALVRTLEGQRRIIADHTLSGLSHGRHHDGASHSEAMSRLSDGPHGFHDGGAHSEADLRVMVTLPDNHAELQHRLQQLLTGYWQPFALRMGLQLGLPERAAEGNLHRPTELLRLPGVHAQHDHATDIGCNGDVAAVAEAWRELGLLQFSKVALSVAAAPSLQAVAATPAAKVSATATPSATQAAAAAASAAAQNLEFRVCSSKGSRSGCHESRYELTAMGQMLLPGSPQRDKAVFWTQDRYLQAWLPGLNVTRSHVAALATSGTMPVVTAAAGSSPSADASHNGRTSPKDSFAAISNDANAVQLSRRVLQMHAAADWAGIEALILPHLLPLRRALGRPLTVVDVGGGSGTLLRQLTTPLSVAPPEHHGLEHTTRRRHDDTVRLDLAEAIRGARLLCFERPEVAALNRAADEGVRSQAATRPSQHAAAAAALDSVGFPDSALLHIGGDMFCPASLPAGADVYMLSRVLHDWDDCRALQLLQAIREAATGAHRATRSADAALSIGSYKMTAAAADTDAAAASVNPVAAASSDAATQPLLIVVDRVASEANAHGLLSLHMHLQQGSRERWADEWSALFAAGGWTSVQAPSAGKALWPASAPTHHRHAVMVLLPKV